VSCSTNASYGWDHIVPSIVKLGSTLFDTGTAKSFSFFNPESTLPKSVSKSGTLPDTLAAFRLNEDVSFVPELSATANMIRIGAKLLRGVFISHKAVRREVVEQILCRILVGATSSGSALPSVFLLGHLVSERTHMFMEYAPKIKDALNYISMMPTHMAQMLLKAIAPLFELQRDLKDHVILILRKCMFKQGQQARLTAVNGFLHLVTLGRFW